MIDRFEAISTEETPGVILDGSLGVFQFSGKSLPENANEFFSGILNWFRSYANEPNKETQLIFKMEYFNSSTSRKFMEIFIVMEDLITSDHTVNVKWYYLKNDKMIESRGKEFSAIVDVPFEFIEY